MRNIKLKHNISFHEWCVKNNLYELLNRWDYYLNKFSPNNIAWKANKYIWLKCGNSKHHSERFKVSNGVTYYEKYGTLFKCKQCNSFAQWAIDNIGEDFFDIYWDSEKNKNLEPFKIAATHNGKVFIRCAKTNYHNSYQVSCANFSKGKRCPYCAGKKVHPKDSFGQFNINNTDKNFIKNYWSSKNKISPFEITPYSHKQVFIKCQNKGYHADYKITAAKFTKGRRCPYCSRVKVHKFDSIANTHPLSDKLWSEKNNTDAYSHFYGSAKKIWWRCENGIHNDYERSLKASAKLNFRCPDCVRKRNVSLLQEKVSSYIKEKYNFQIYHEYKCSIVAENPFTKGRQGQMPYDNEIVITNNDKLIVEVQGKQHSTICYFHEMSAKQRATTPEKELVRQQWRDQYKREYAIDRGYYYLEIPYTSEKNDGYKTIIDKKIQEIILVTQ